ncbi:MAG: recombinase family protein [Oscillospiraceae bacterium]|nr:recombinase family protein [Oscillospiraceae bacterium]
MTYTIAKYLRISAEDIDLDGFDKYESNSIVNQRGLLDDFISRIPEFEDCEVIEELDDGRTGTNFSRPGVQRLIELAQSGKVNCIIVKDLSRWGRNYLEVGDFLEQKFPAWGTRFISINDVYDSAKLNGATGGIDIAFRNLIYEMYSHDLSEKVRAGKIAMAKQGKHLGGYDFFGYKKDPNDRHKLIIDLESAATIKRIYELAAQGKTLNEIARQLNTEGRATAQQSKTKQGSKMQWTNGEANFWYGSMVSNILHDERYTGKLITGKHRVEGVGSQKFIAVPKEEWIVVDGAIPAIITQAEFDEVRAKMSSRLVSANKPGKSKLLFSRKLRCAYCGLSLKAVKRTHDVKYHCDTAGYTNDYGCQKDWIAEDDVKKAVFTALRQQIAFADEARKLFEIRAAEVLPSIEKYRKEIERLKKTAEKARTAKIGLWERYHLGELSGEAFQRENEKADEQVKNCESKIGELECRILEMEISTGQENTFVERFSKQVGITELTRPIVEELINTIKVYAPDRIEIVFNYSDEYAKILELTSVGNKKRVKS